MGTYQACTKRPYFKVASTHLTSAHVAADLVSEEYAAGIEKFTTLNDLRLKPMPPILSCTIE